MEQETRLLRRNSVLHHAPSRPVASVHGEIPLAEFIADPAMNPQSEGPAMLVFFAGEPLPETPVIAPEIHIREGAE